MKIQPRSKYRAVPTVVDGIRFASKKEARRYGELKLMEKAGHIQRLALQVPYELEVTVWTVEERLKTAAALLRGKLAALPRVKIGTYVADFAYDERILKDSENDHYRRVVEDAKGFRTPLYRWKKKHFEAQYGIQIREV